MFNLMDVIFLAVIGLIGFIGYKQGFIKTIINFASFFVAIGLALLFYKQLAIILTENTQIDEWIVEHIVTTEVKDTEEEQQSNSESKGEATSIEEFISNLPETITNNLDLEDTKNLAKKEIANKVSETIMNLLSLIIIYVVVKVTLLIASIVLDIMMKLPVLKQLNEILGLVVGLIMGIIDMSIVFAIITFISSITDISFITEAIKASLIARVLFENNIVIKLLF